VEHITTQLLPRTTPYLNRLISLQRSRELERQLRAEQDQAFASAEARDKLRLEAKLAEQRAQEERAREAERRAREEEDRRRREEKERELRALEEEEKRKREEQERELWRRWARRAIVGPQSAALSGAPMRLAIRLPHSPLHSAPAQQRIIAHFDSNQHDLTDLYAFVDAKLIPDIYTPSDDPTSPPSSSGAGSPKQVLEARIASAPPYFPFTLATSYPRTPIPWSANVKLSQVECLRGAGAQVVVEMRTSASSSVAGTPRRSLEENADDSDGYDTEED